MERLKVKKEPIEMDKDNSRRSRFGPSLRILDAGAGDFLHFYRCSDASLPEKCTLLRENLSRASVLKVANKESRTTIRAGDGQPQNPKLNPDDGRTQRFGWTRTTRSAIITFRRRPRTFVAPLQH